MATGCRWGGGCAVPGDSRLRLYRQASRCKTMHVALRTLQSYNAVFHLLSCCLQHTGWYGAAPWLCCGLHTSLWAQPTLL